MARVGRLNAKTSIVVLGSALVAAALTSIAPVAAQTTAMPRIAEINSASSCRDVVWVAARGSGEKYDDDRGMGGPVSKAFDVWSKSLPNHRIGYYSIPYEAQAVETLALVFDKPNPFFVGIDNGVNQTLQVLRHRRARCPRERIVMAGYSQGAMVMHRAVWRIDSETTVRNGGLLRDRIDGILVIADGDRVPAQGGFSYGTQTGSSKVQDWGIGTLLPGLNPSASPARRTPLPSWARAVFHSVCDKDDLVCDPMHSLGLLSFADYTGPWPRIVATKAVRISNGVSIHTKRYRPGDGVTSAVNAIANRGRTKQRFAELTSADLPTSATVGTPFSQQLVARGGSPRYTWTLRQGAPGIGLTGDRLTGTPTLSGAFDIVLLVSDSAGQATEVRGILNVSAPRGQMYSKQSFTYNTNYWYPNAGSASSNPRGDFLFGDWAYGNPLLVDWTRRDPSFPFSYGYYGLWSDSGTDHPGGTAIDDQGNIITSFVHLPQSRRLAEQVPWVTVFSPSGQRLSQFSPTAQFGEHGGAAEVRTDSAGRIYLTDAGSAHVYTRQGEFIETIGIPGPYTIDPRGIMTGLHTYSTGEPDPYLLRRQPDGSWERLPYALERGTSSIDSDAAGNIYVSGSGAQSAVVRIGVDGSVRRFEIPQSRWDNGGSHSTKAVAGGKRNQVFVVFKNARPSGDWTFMELGLIE